MKVHETHKLRSSDSSFYDEVCVKCGYTDASGSIGLELPCTGNFEKQRMSEIKHKLEYYQDIVDELEKEYQKLKESKND